MQKNFYKVAVYVLLFLLVCSHLGKEDCEKNSQSKLSHLVIPFHINQIASVEENIRKWATYKPCASIHALTRPRLIFYVSFTDDSQLTDLNTRLSALKENFYCFSNRDKIEVVEYKLRPEHDTHILGARLMFENCLKRNHVLFNNLKYIFYMEPDCRPIRSNWLTAIQNEIGTTSFWMKGAFFRGTFQFFANEREYLPNKYHINGNAIYNVGDKRFEEFYFNKVRPYIQLHGDSVTAYDTDLAEYIMDLRNYIVVREVIHNFAFTEVVLNMWRQSYSVAELKKLYANSFLVHGGSSSDW